MLSDVASKVEKSGKHDKNYLCGLYQSLESTVQKEITQLQTSLNKAEDSEDALRKKFVECESKYNSCLQYFEKSQQDYETKSAELQKQCQTHLAQLERIHEKQKKLVDRFGSSNTHVLQLQLESLQKMKEQLARNNIMEEDSLVELKRSVLFLQFGRTETPKIIDCRRVHESRIVFKIGSWVKRQFPVALAGVRSWRG